MAKCKLTTKEEKLEALNNKRNELLQQQSEGYKVDKALSTLDLVIKNIDNPVRVNNILKLHDKGFTSIPTKTILDTNKKNPLVNGESVTLTDGYIDNEGNKKFNVLNSNDENILVHGYEIQFNPAVARYHKAQNKYTELANDLWNDPDKVLTLFDELAAIEGQPTEHVLAQRELLKEIYNDVSPILNNFKVFIDKSASTNEGVTQIDEFGSDLKLNINSSMASNGEITATEAFMKEMIKLSTEMAMQYKQGAMYTTMKNLKKVNRLAAKNITVEDLTVNGDTKRAEKYWYDLFESDNSLSNFMSSGLTDEKLIALLKTKSLADLKEANPSFEGEFKLKSIWHYLSKTIGKVYNFFSGLLEKDSLETNIIV